MTSKHVGRFTVLVLLAVMSAGLWVSPVWAAEDVARWAPAESWVYVGIPSCDNFAEGFKSTLTYKATQDPDVKDIVEPLTKLFENAKKVLAEELGLESPKALELYPHGGAALFLTAEVVKDKDPVPHIGAVLDMGEDIAKAKELVTSITRVSLDKGGKKDVTSVGGIEITTIKFEPKPGDVAARADAGQRVAELLDGVVPDEMQAIALQDVMSGTDTPDEFSFAFVESRFLVGSDTDTVKATVKRLSGGKAGTLAGTPVVRTMNKHCAEQRHAEVVLNIPQMLRQTSENDEEARRAISAAGLSALGAWVGTLELAPTKKIDSRFRGFMEVAADRTGVAKLLMMPNLRTAPPATVGADAVAFAMVNLGPNEVLAEVLAIMERYDPAEAEQVRAGMKMPRPDGTVLDVQKDLVGNLVGPMMGALTLAKPYDAANVNFFIALGQKSRDAMVSLLGEMGAGLLMPSQMQGNPMYESPMMPGATLGFTERAMILLATKNGAEAYMRGETKTDGGLADQRNFRQVARHAPDKASIVVYSDSPAIFDAQKAIHESGTQMQPAIGMSSLGDFVRYGLAGEYPATEAKNPEAMRKYLTLQLWTVTTESDGLRTDLVQVVPPKSSGDGK